MICGFKNLKEPKGDVYLNIICCKKLKIADYIGLNKFRNEWVDRWNGFLIAYSKVDKKLLNSAFGRKSMVLFRLELHPNILVSLRSCELYLLLKIRWK